jgi:peptide/nickel transport system substrate-binding protein
MRINATTGIALSCAAAALALSACSRGTDSSSSAPPATVRLTTSVDAPKGEVDSITWNLGNGEPTTIDPAQSTLDNVSTVVGNLCEGLMTFGPGYEIEPALAEKVTQPDDTTYVFDLRPDAAFWDGKPVTPDDVIYSINRTRADATASSWATAFSGVESITATGANQVTIKFESPTAMFRWYQATPATAVVEKDYVESAGKTFGTSTGGVMCTGPYELESWDSGQDLTITRNDDYRGDEPLVKQVRFTFDTDAASRTAALLNGDVDGSFTTPVASARRLLDTDEGSLMYGESLSPVFISTFVSDPAIQIPEVRSALHKLIDYDGISENVFGGAAIPIKTLTPPPTWGYAKDVFQAAYDALPDARQDLDGAKSDVEAAGDVPQMTFAYDNSNAEESKVALSIQSSAKELGLDIELRSLAPNDFFKIFYDPGAREGLSGYVLSGYLDFPEPLEYDEYLTTGSYYNYAGYDNPKYDELIEEAQGTLDDTRRAELATRAEAIAAADRYNVPLVSPYLNVFVNKRLTGLVPEQRFLYTPWAASLGATQ